MVPQAILDRLGRVRRREVAVRLAWGAARWIALAAAAMFVFCLIDWIIDLRRDTPQALRGLMLLVQIALWIGAAAVLVARPLLRPRDERQTALWIEEKFPDLGHRLISAVQLNRQGAAIEGMSGELIAAVTREAEAKAAATDFAREVDLRPVKRGLFLVLAVVAVALLLIKLSPQTVGALVARQFMADREIPRSVRLASEKLDQVRPSGEEVVLRFMAEGASLSPTSAGEIRIDPKERPSEYYPLVFESAPGPGRALFSAIVPPSTVDFEVRAWLGDGRTRKPSHVVYEPRPVVKRLEAWVVLPKYCGLRPDGTPYELHRPRGEVAGPKGSSIRVSIQTQKPVVKGVLEILGRATPEAAQETVLRTTELTLGKDGLEAEGVFDLRPVEAAYRIVVEDRHGFQNSSPPRRGTGIVADEPPRVVLLPERFSLPGEIDFVDDTVFEGMPIPLGSAVRVAYYCSQPYGLDRARFAFRIIKGGKPPGDASGGSPEVPWRFLPLGEVKETAESGPFDLRRGAFRNTGLRDQVEFHPLPSPDPERVLGRTEGGGCFDYQTRPIAGLQVGDQIEFYIEAFARNPDLERSPGRSETRSKMFVTQPQFMEWLDLTLKHKDKISQLESKQRGVFTPEGTDR